MSQVNLKLAAATVVAASALSSLSYATDMSNQQLENIVSQIVAQKTQGLQNEVSQLKAQIVSLKKQLNKQQTTATTSQSINNLTSSTPNVQQAQSQYVPRNNQYATTYEGESSSAVNSSRIPVRKTTPQQIQRSSVQSTAKNNVLTGVYLAGTPIFTSPYIGEHSAYDGSNLIVNESSVNLDARLLKQQQAMQNTLLQDGIPLPDHPVVEASGEVEAIAFDQNVRPGNSKSDINLSDAELDLYAQVDPWVFGYTSFAWQDTNTYAYRVANANAIIDKAFITVGNLHKTPFYASLGQLYVPFGQYSSYMISDPLTKLLARTKARAGVLGFQPQGTTGPFGSIYVFRDDTQSSDHSAAGGVNMGYDFGEHDINGSLGAGLISNIADSEGMQLNYAPSSIPFSGFGINSTTENIYKAVPAADVNANIGYKSITLLGEYIDTTTDFNPNAMTFNGNPARPSAGQVEADYAFTLHGKPGNFALGYDWTENALALLLPQQRYLATVNYSFWRSTVESLEFRHDVNYSAATTATGAGSPAFNPLNKYVNMLTFQFAVFF